MKEDNNNAMSNTHKDLKDTAPLLLAAPAEADVNTRDGTDADGQTLPHVLTPDTPEQAPGPDSAETVPLFTRENAQAPDLGAEENEPDKSEAEANTAEENAAAPKTVPAAEPVYEDGDTISFPKQEAAAAALRREKKKKTGLIALGALLAALLGVYLWGAWFYSSHFLPHTTVSGLDVGNKDAAEVTQMINHAAASRSVELRGKDGQTGTISAEQVDFKITKQPDLQGALNAQNVWRWPEALFKKDGKNLTGEYTLNKDKLTAALKALPIVSGSQVQKTKNAQAQYDGTQFTIQDAVYGTEVDMGKLTQAVTDAFTNGTPVLDLDKDKLYVQPAVTKDTPALKASVDKLNTALATTVTYDFQTAKETLDKNTFVSWLSTDAQGNPVVDAKAAAAYVESLADKYDTIGQPVDFKTTGGSTLRLEDWYHGWEIDQEAETKDLQNIILEGKAVTREPDWESKGGDRSKPKSLGNTYLEISIPDQTMWYYKDGKLVVSTPVVTGDTTQGHGTPTGLYDLQGKSTDVTLTGDDYASPVTFWMPFDGGYGVHDSSWRSDYGGAIYEGNGSHGCVNTPYDAAATIYDNISVGDPVILY